MQQTETSKTDWIEFRKFEAEKHQWFLQKYKKLGMEVIEDIYNDTKTNAGNKAALNLQKCLLNFFNKDKVKVCWPTKYNDFGDAIFNGDLEYIKEWYNDAKN